MARPVILLVSLVACCLVPVPASAGQTVGTTTGAINGTVTDDTGAVMRDVTIAIVGDALMGARTAQTNAEGFYRFPALPPGTYALVSTMTGFRTVNRAGINIGLGFTATVDVALEIAALQDQVIVEQTSPDFNEIKYLGGDDVTTLSARTPDQTQIGLFWIESSPLAWNRLARALSASQGLDLWENARLFGLLNMALADGYIGSWETKYHYNYWRPETAIRTADTDGNPNTEGDATWTPLEPTYPHPDYDSGHAVEGGTAAQVFKRFFGTDDISFTACSLSLPSGQTCTDPGAVFRSYNSFSEAADENGVSRILIGIHFRNAIEVGIEHGRKIADRAVNRFLRPVH